MRSGETDGSVSTCYCRNHTPRQVVLQAWPGATALLAGDARVQQFWDPTGEAGKRFARTLDLPLKTPAWDAYLLYLPGRRWEDSPPLPGFWMHQLGFAPWSEAGKKFGSLRLDGEKYRQEVEKALQGMQEGKK